MIGRGSITFNAEKDRINLCKGTIQIDGPGLSWSQSKNRFSVWVYCTVALIKVYCVVQKVFLVFFTIFAVLYEYIIRSLFQDRDENTNFIILWQKKIKFFGPLIQIMNDLIIFNFKRYVQGTKWILGKCTGKQIKNSVNWLIFFTCKRNQHDFRIEN